MPTTSPVVVATLGFTAGGEIGGVVLEGERPAAAIVDLGAGSVFSAGMEWSNGGRLWFGPGLTIASLPDPFSFDENNRTVTSFDLRGRASVGIARGWGVDFGVVGGLTRWADDGLGTLWGWTYRFAGGPSYEVQPGLTLVAELAFWRADVSNREGLFSDEFTEPQPVAAAAWILSVGARLW